MSKKQQQQNRESVVVEQEAQEQKFPTELLVKSKQLSQFNLHPCLIRAILEDEQEYTISEAKEAIQKYIDSFNP